MEAREIYHVLKSIVEPIHSHSDQMVAIAKWIESEFEYKPHKETEKDHSQKVAGILHDLSNLTCVNCDTTGNIEWTKICGSCGKEY